MSRNTVAPPDALVLGAFRDEALKDEIPNLELLVPAYGAGKSTAVCTSHQRGAAIFYKRSAVLALLYVLATTCRKLLEGPFK